MRKYCTAAGFVVGIVMIFMAAAHAASVTLAIPIQEVDVRQGMRGDSNVVILDLPEDLAGKRLDSVFLDFVVDATPTNKNDAETTPWIGAYPLTAAATDQTIEYTSDVPSVRPIAMGENQQVRMDITDIVKGWLANPTSNHGLVIGALTGPAVATVSLKSSSFDGAALRVMFYYQYRSGERVSTK